MDSVLGSVMFDQIAMRDELISVYEETRDSDILDSALMLAHEIVEEIPDGHPDRARNLSTLARYLEYRYHETGLLIDLHQMILYATDTVHAIFDGDPSQELYCGRLSDFLYRRYRRTGFMVDLDLAISYALVAVKSTDEIGRTIAPEGLFHQSRSRFERVGLIADLHNAIRYGKLAIEGMARDNPRRHTVFSGIAQMIKNPQNMFQQSVMSALAKVPKGHPRRAFYLSKMSTIRYLKYQRTESTEDIYQAVVYARDALEETVEGDPDGAGRLDNLGQILNWRSRLDADMHDLGIVVAEDQLISSPWDDPQRGSLLGDLTAKLIWRGKVVITRSVPGDLDQANSYTREALEGNAGADSAAFSSTLSKTLDARFEQEIAYLKVVLATTDERDLDRDDLLKYLGVIIFTRYEQEHDLDSYLRDIASIEGPVRIQDTEQLILISILAMLLQCKFEASGVLDYLQQAIYYGQIALTGELPERTRVAISNQQVVRYRIMYEKTETAEDLQSCVSGTKALLEMISPISAGASTLLNNLGGLFLSRYEKTRDVDDLEQALVYTRGALTGSQDDNRSRVEILSKLANILHLRYKRTVDIHDLKHAIQYHEEAMANAPAHYPNRAEQLTVLAAALFSRYQSGRDIADLEKAISYSEVALATAKENPERLILSFRLLANYTFHRYRHSRAVDDLRRAITYIRKALGETPVGNTSRVDQLSVLGGWLNRLYTETNETTDLQEAIQCLEDALEQAPNDNPNRINLMGRLEDWKWKYNQVGPIRHLHQAVPTDESRMSLKGSIFEQGPPLTSLIKNLTAVFLQTKDLGNLKQAIIYSEQLLETTPPDHPDRPDFLAQAGYIYYWIFEKGEELKDLQKAILYTHEALIVTQLSPAKRFPILLNQVKHLGHRYELLRDRKDFDLVSSYVEEALVALSPDHPVRFRFLAALADCYDDNYDAGRNIEELDQAILHRQEALNGEKSDRHRIKLVWRLSLNLKARYLAHGALDDLDRAIACVEEGPGDLIKNAVHLDYISSLLSVRFERTGVMWDLKRALECAQDAVKEITEETTEDEKTRYLTNLSTRFHQRFRRTSRLADMEQAEFYSRKALEVVSEKVPLLTIQTLGISLLGIYRRSKAMDMLEEAITLFADCLAKCTEENPDKPAFLVNMSNSLELRYDCTKAIEDIDQAIVYLEECLSIVPRNHPAASHAQSNLALNLLKRSKHMDSPDDLSRAVCAFKESFNSSGLPLTTRMQAALTLSGVLYSSPQLGGVQDASAILEDAVLIMKMVTSNSLDSSDMLYPKLMLNNLSATAASVTLEAGKSAYDALKLLEIGRGTVMGLSINCRSDLSDLKHLHPGLFNKLNNLRTEIDVPIQELVNSKLYPDETPGVLRRRQLAVQDIEKTVEEIRKLPGHDQFQLPASPAQLLSMANEGPIITVISSTYRSDAIIVTPSEIKSVSLPRLLSSEVSDRLAGGAIGKLACGTLRTYGSRSKSLREVLLWLWDVAVKPVLDELKLTAQSVDDSTCLPHIWWVGVGLLATAPFHAAGDYSPNSNPLDNTMSYAISSYTPTIKALAYAREKQFTILNNQKPNKSPRLLLVTMPDTPGHADLPDAIEEVSTIIEVTSGLIESTPLTRPSAEQVLGQLAFCSAAHFACHGISDSLIPQASHLVLVKDGVEDQLRVEDVSRRNTETAQLAYLSACSTADNVVSGLLDEGLDLATSFQLAGFSHVLGTMWQADSKVCKEVAVDFYRLLFNGTGTGHQQVGAAFHAAVRTVQKKHLRAPLKWAPFIHLGA